MTEIKREISLDLLKTCSIFIVILAHFDMTTPVGPHILLKRVIDLTVSVPIFLVITGYTHSRSMDRYGSGSIFPFYGKSYMHKRLLRALLPYMVTIAAELLLAAAAAEPADPGEWMRSALYTILVQGAWGPGGYYPPVFIQIILWLPLMYVMFRRHPLCAFVFFLCLHLGFEMAHSLITDDFYRISSFRYIACVLMGMFLLTYRQPLKGTYIPHLCFAAGLIYLVAVRFLGYESRLFTRWTNTALPTAFYAFSIVWGAMELEPLFQRFHKLLSPCHAIGRASYHIFFVQMIYYGPVQSTGCNLTRINEMAGKKWSLLFSLALCIALGCAWYRAESYLCGRKFSLQRSHR